VRVGFLLLSAFQNNGLWKSPHKAEKEVTRKMGITIHYRFMIRNRDALCSLLKEIKSMAVKLGMRILQEKETCLVVHPHPKCESLNLDFERYADVKERAGKQYSYEAETLKDFKVLGDNDFVCSSHTKTQYAGYRTHMLVAEILRKMHTCLCK
jgi:hypothetical protein